MTTIDYLHSDYVTRRNGELIPVTGEDDSVSREELIAAFQDLLDNKLVKYVARMLIGIAITLAYVALFYLTSDPNLP